MREAYERRFSRILGRPMEELVFSAEEEKGESRLCLAFPPQNGRFYDLKDFGLIQTAGPWISSGRLKIVCVDGIDAETWSKEGDPRERIERQEQWFRFITEELLPACAADGKKALAIGCSMGAVHAGNFFFRRPDLFDGMIGLSGTYNAGFFFRGYMDELVYANSPAHFLPNMPPEHPWMQLYRESRIILCCGQGPWEEEQLAGTRELDGILNAKNIPHRADYWGWDVAHDWYWWKKQLPYFLDQLGQEGYL